MSGFQDYNSAARVKAAIEKIARDAISAIYQRPRYATVVSLDGWNRKIELQYPGDPETFIVDYPAQVYPQAAGQTVRVEGTQGDRYIAAVFGDTWANYTNGPLSMHVAGEAVRGYDSVGGFFPTFTWESDRTAVSYTYGGFEVRDARFRISDGFNHRLLIDPAGTEWYFGAGADGIKIEQGLTAGVPEVQTLTPSGTISGGTFTLTILGVTTAAIAFNATAAQIYSAISAADPPPGNEIIVTGGPINTSVVTLTYSEYYGNVAQVVVNSSLTGTAPLITPATTTTGVKLARTRWTAFGYDRAHVDLHGRATFAQTTIRDGTSADGINLYLKGTYASEIQFWANRFNGTGPAGSVKRGGLSVSGNELLRLWTEDLTGTTDGTIHLDSAGRIRLEADDQIEIVAGGTNYIRFDINSIEQARWLDTVAMFGKTASNLSSAGIELFMGSSANKGRIYSTVETTLVPNVFWNHESNADGNAQIYETYRRLGTNILGSVSQVNTTGVAYNITSDRRLKNIYDGQAGWASNDEAIAKFMKLEFRIGEYKSEPGKRAEFLIAQQVYEVDPRYVLVGSGEPGDKDFVPWQMDYGAISVLYGGALQGAIWYLVQAMEDIKVIQAALKIKKK